MPGPPLVRVPLRSGFVSDGDPRLRLVFEESRRSLTEQQGVLDEVRARAGMVLSAASIATGFLGGVALSRHPLGGWSVVAILAFAGMAVVALLVLYPWGGWYFRFPAYDLLNDYVEGKDALDLDAMLRDLSIDAEANYAHNAGKIVWLHRGLSWAIGLLSAQIVAWLLAIA